VALKATEQPVDTSTAAGKAFLDMLGVFAEFKTNLRRERQMEGIAAKARAVRQLDDAISLRPKIAEPDSWTTMISYRVVYLTTDAMPSDRFRLTRSDIPISFSGDPALPFA
jgi:hypothetical protein